MAALRSRCGHYIFVMWFLLLSSFFPHLISVVAAVDVYHTSTHGVACLSANLECRSEMCCTRLAENIGRKKKIAKNRHLRTIEQLCRAISLQLRHISTIGKIVKQQYLLHMSSRYGELRLTSS